jgi:hypothetical protein
VTGARVGRGEVPSGARETILARGSALAGGACAFLGVFSYLAARFQYRIHRDQNGTPDAYAGR